MADRVTPIFVPMLVNAYVNYDRRKATDASEQAIVAPITTPNFNALSQHNDLLKHDVFDDLPQGPYLSTCDPQRVVPSRRGIYVHWVLPKHYRTAVTGSNPTTVNDQAAKAGYVNADADDKPTYHQVPTRWYIIRRIRAGYDPIIYQRLRKDGSGGVEQEQVRIDDRERQDSGDKLKNNVLTNIYVVDGVQSIMLMY